MTAPPLSAPEWLADDGCWHIDVRGLPPPQPLVLILTLVDRVSGEGRAVIVHHDRDPRLLYPELAQRGWQARHEPGDPNELRLRLEPP